MRMIKKYKWTLLITSVVILLPIYFGYMLWDELPDMMATHWGVDNQPNGYSSKAMAVYGIPLIMLALQWFMLFMTELDMKKKNHSMKLMQLVLWIIPMMTLLVSAMCYAYALGIELNIGFWALFFLGCLFTVIGNYLPKCRQNWTMGIRIRWTLDDAENWNHTHRLAGPVWVAGGLLLVVCSFFSRHTIALYGSIAVILLMVTIPTVYSYLYYKQHSEE